MVDAMANAASHVAQVPDGATPSWSRRLTAEAFGTFALVFVAVGGDAMASVSGGAITPVARAVAPALMVAALIYAVGDASGAHFNPVVSLAFVFKRLFPPAWLAPYWAAQIGGAIAAAAVVRILFGGNVAAGVSTPHIDPGPAVALEAILTLLLVTVILGTADRYRIIGHQAAIAVGGTIALCGLIALPIDGASMNPARSLAPALVAGDMANAWIYVVGPLIGATVAVAVTRFLHGPTESDAKALEAAQGDAHPAAADGGAGRAPRPAIARGEIPATDP